MQFSRIALTNKGKKILISYSKDGEDTIVKSPEQARPQFYTALKDLRTPAMVLCELPDTWSPNVEAIGLNFHHANDKVSVEIMATRTLSDGKTKMQLITPKIGSEQLDTQTSAQVTRLEGEAMLFIRGKRAQERIPFRENKQPQARAKDTPLKFNGASATPGPKKTTKKLPLRHTSTVRIPAQNSQIPTKAQRRAEKERARRTADSAGSIRAAAEMGGVQ